jgi:hypothetical protein
VEKSVHPCCSSLLYKQAEKKGLVKRKISQKKYSAGPAENRCGEFDLVVCNGHRIFLLFSAVTAKNFQKEKEEVD